MAALDKKSIRDWTLYVMRFSDGHYYIGITAYRDFMKRVNQHGSQFGAKVNKNKTIEEIIEIQHLGKLTRQKAEQIENNVTLQYRKKFGSRKVRGGYNLFSTSNIVPTYTPGSVQSYIFVLTCLLISIFIFIIMIILIKNK